MIINLKNNQVDPTRAELAAPKQMALPNVKPLSRCQLQNRTSLCPFLGRSLLIAFPTSIEWMKIPYIISTRKTQQQNYIDFQITYKSIKMVFMNSLRIIWEILFPRSKEVQNLS